MLHMMQLTVNTAPVSVTDLTAVSTGDYHGSTGHIGGYTAAEESWLEVGG